MSDTQESTRRAARTRTARLRRVLQSRPLSADFDGDGVVEPEERREVVDLAQKIARWLVLLVALLLLAVVILSGAAFSIGFEVPSLGSFTVRSGAQGEAP